MVGIRTFWPLTCAIAFSATLVLAAIVPTGTVAQSDNPAPNAAPPPAEAKPEAAAADKPAAPTRGKVQVPLDQALLLVRTTLLTLNDANRSGNYTVLRDLGSLEFQARNSSADLALVFAEMRRSNLSLFSVMLLSPQLTTPPEIDADNHLRVSGYVPTSPQQIRFELVYESSTRQWKLLNINISTTPLVAAKPPDQEQKAGPKPPVQAAKPTAKPTTAPKAAQPWPQPTPAISAIPATRQ